MKTPEQIADEAIAGYVLLRHIAREDVREIAIAAIEADRAQRADEFQMPEPWGTTLRIIKGDGDEYTDTVNIRFTREWDHDLTREHTIMWSTFVKALAVIAREEGEA